MASLLLALGLLVPTAEPKTDGVAVFHDRGAWCWFQDERVIIDRGRLLLGVVASGPRDDKRRGSVEIGVYHLATGQRNVVELHRALEQDDHDAPALLVRGDGRYLAMYTKHGSDNLIRYRISTQPGDPTSWQPERTFARPNARVTYSNLFRLDKENAGRGRLYDFYRGEGWNPNIITSDDDGETWSYCGKLVVQPKCRPYLKYASNGVDEIHFVFGEGHPAEYKAGTSIYHAYYRDGALHRSDDKVISKLADGPIVPGQATQVFRGDPGNMAWACDLHLDRSGHPYLAYSVCKDQEGSDHRYRFARWDGDRWRDYEIAYAGSRLYRGEEHYTGNVALNPRNPNELYISTNADPTSGQPLLSNADGKRHWEVFRGKTRDDGKTWAWTPVTVNSTADNLRPIVPFMDGEQPMLLWLRGRYTTFRDWEMEVVGHKEPPRTPLTGMRERRKQ